MTMGVRDLIDRIFQHEEINGHGACPTYLHRWILASVFGCKMYLHKFTGEDWAIDPHDHPKTFVSIGLWVERMERCGDDLEPLVKQEDGEGVRPILGPVPEGVRP